MKQLLLASFSLKGCYLIVSHFWFFSFNHTLQKKVYNTHYNKRSLIEFFRDTYKLFCFAAKKISSFAKECIMEESIEPS